MKQRWGLDRNVLRPTPGVPWGVEQHHWNTGANENHIWTASSEFGTYRLCEQRMFRRACASAQSRQNLRCSLIQAVSQEEPSDRKPDPWPLWMAGHAQLKFVMTECSKTQIRLTGLKYESKRGTIPAYKFRKNCCSCFCKMQTYQTDKGTTTTFVVFL